jgi:hypothetical protein
LIGAPSDARAFRFLWLMAPLIGRFERARQR